MRANKIHRYRPLFENSLGKWIFVLSKRRTKDFDGSPVTENWDLFGKIVKVNKNAIKILLNDEIVVTIGYRTIISTRFKNAHLVIKYKLYYKHR